MATEQIIDMSHNSAQTVSEQQVDQVDSEPRGWRGIATLSAAGVVVAGAFSLGLAKAYTKIPGIGPIVESSPQVMNIAPNIYGGVAVGAAAGACLAISTQKERIASRFAGEVAGASLLGASAVYMNHRLGGALFEAGMQPGMSEPKAMVFGAYLGLRQAALRNPYQPTGHPAMSVFPAARASWFVGQKLRGLVHR